MDADICHSMDYFSGSVSSQSVKNYYVMDAVKENSYTKEICATYIFRTDAAAYNVRVLFGTGTTGQSEDIGIQMLEIQSQEDIHRAIEQNTSDALDKFKFHSVDGFYRNMVSSNAAGWYNTGRYAPRDAVHCNQLRGGIKPIGSVNTAQQYASPSCSPAFHGLREAIRSL